jgi:hypothetical protein
MYQCGKEQQVFSYLKATHGARHYFLQESGRYKRVEIRPKEIKQHEYPQSRE